jgi:acetylornithine deacetylase/succinyl-diaminopimelate desuccinylase-like protein
VLDRDLDPARPDEWLPLLGGAARMIGATIRNTSNPTMLEAGYKANVIPGRAEAVIDCRFLPGQEEQLLSTIDELIGPDVTRQSDIADIAVETTFDGAVVQAMCDALKAEDPQAVPLPYLMSGGTDAKSFSLLGMRCFGFSPLQMPADLDFMSLFHGIDERVPVDALQFGVRVLDRFLSAC